MRRLAIIVALGIVMGLLFRVQHVLKPETINSNPEQLCSLAFSKTGATLLESRLDAWATIKKSSDLPEMKRLLRKVGQELDIEVDEKLLSTTASPELLVAGTSAVQGDRQYLLTAQCSQGSTMVLISIISSERECPEFHKYQEAIRKVVPASTAVQCTAAITGDVGTAGRRKLIEQMFTTLGARTIEVYEKGNTVSATGHTPLISNSLGYEKKQYNLQAAVRYNAVEDKTYIYLGSPLLLGDY